MSGRGLTTRPEDIAARREFQRIRDQFNFPSACARRTSDLTGQSNLGYVAVPFQQRVHETYRTPTQGMWDGSTALYAPIDGLYVVSYSARMTVTTANAAFQAYMQITDSVTAAVQWTELGSSVFNDGAGVFDGIGYASGQSTKPMKKGHFVQLICRAGSSTGSPSYSILAGTELCLDYYRPYPL